MIAGVLYSNLTWWEAVGSFLIGHIAGMVTWFMRARRKAHAKMLRESYAKMSLGKDTSWRTKTMR